MPDYPGGRDGRVQWPTAPHLSAVVIAADPPRDADGWIVRIRAVRCRCAALVLPARSEDVAIGSDLDARALSARAVDCRGAVSRSFLSQQAFTLIAYLTPFSDRERTFLGWKGWCVVARRRRRRRNSNEGLLLAIGGLFLAAAVLSWTGRFVAAHATAIILTAVALVAAAAVTGVLVIRARMRQAARQAERDRNIAVTDAMSGPQFEQYVARLMRRDGLRRVQVCGGSGDLGADITAYTDDGRKVVVQCKRYAGSVGDPHVQKFNGTARPIHSADIPVLVTTGRPTSKARQLGQRCGIVLIDRDTLAVWATDRVLPVSLAPRSKPGRSATTRPAEQPRLESGMS